MTTHLAHECGISLCGRSRREHAGYDDAESLNPLLSDCDSCRVEWDRRLSAGLPLPLLEIDGYDWGEVFGCCGEPGHNNYEVAEPTEQRAGSKPFTRWDVLRVVAKSEGQNDGPPWLIVFESVTGEFVFVMAGCDFTGWDCQSSGKSWWASSLGTLEQCALTDEARERLDIKENDNG